MSYNDIAKNSSTQPLSSVFYYDVHDGKFSDNENDLNDMITRFKSRFKKGQIAYIKHKGEHGKSDHIHIIVRNNTQKGFENVPSLRNDILYSIAYVVTEHAKIGDAIPSPPLRTSNLADWYGYSLHKKEYFDKKKIPYDKEFTYNHDDIKGDKSFIDEMKILYDEMMASDDYSEIDIIYNGVLNGVNDWDIIKKLKYVDSKNLYSVFNGINKVKQSIESKKFDINRAFDILTEFTFENSNIRDNLTDCAFMNKGVKMSNVEIITMLFCEFIKKMHNDDVLNMLFP